MRTNMKKISLSLATSLLFLSPFAAKAQSFQEAQLNEAVKIRAAARFAATASHCLNLTYVGSAAEAVVAITSSTIIAEAPDSTADTTFGTAAGTYHLSHAAYDTAGELCDVIDGLANYQCSLTGCDRSVATSELLDQASTSGTNDLKANGGFNVLFDTGTIGAIGPGFDVRLGITPRVDHRVILKTCTGNANVIGTILVQGKLAKYEGISDGVTRNDTTTVWSSVTADDTDLQVPLDITENGWLEFARNAHVVVSAGNGTSLQAAANFLECQWDEKR